MVLAPPTQQDRAAFVNRMRHAHGPALVPDAALRDSAGRPAESFGKAMARALSGPRRLMVAGTRITVDEPTLKQFKASLASEASGVKDVAALSRIDVVQRLLVGCISFDDDPAASATRKFEWFDDLRISDTLTVGEAIAEAFDFTEMMRRAMALAGKVKGAASLLAETARP